MQTVLIGHQELYMDGASIYFIFPHPLSLKQLTCSSSGSGHYCNLQVLFYWHRRTEGSTLKTCFFSEFPRGDLAVIIAASFATRRYAVDFRTFATLVYC